MDLLILSVHMMFGNYYLMLDFLYYVDFNVISMLLVSNGLLLFWLSIRKCKADRWDVDQKDSKFLKKPLDLAGLLDYWKWFLTFLYGDIE